MSIHWAILLTAIAISMIGQTLLKAGAGAATFVDQLLDWHTILGLALYGGSAIFYIIALRRIPLSVALPATAISYIAATIVGHYGFGEPISLMHFTAVGLIGAGVVLLAFV